MISDVLSDSVEQIRDYLSTPSWCLYSPEQLDLLQECMRLMEETREFLDATPGPRPIIPEAGQAEGSQHSDRSLR